MNAQKKRGWTGKRRRNRSLEEKMDIVRRTMQAMRADPKFELGAYARVTLGVQESLLRSWLNLYAKPWGWEGSVREYDRSRPLPAGLEEPASAEAEPSEEPEAPSAPALPPPSAWTEKFGEQMREAMGLDAESDASTSQTMVSSGEPGKVRRGRKTNAERAEIAARQEAMEPYRPRRVEVQEPDEPQRELPFREPYRAAPVHREEPPAPQGAFMATATAEALRERDAVLTTLKILMRDGGLPTPR